MIMSAPGRKAREKNRAAKRCSVHVSASYAQSYRSLVD
jgi:hypothetical protein